MIHPFLSAEHPIRLAHRGSRALWPENTATAFQGAVDLGYRYIETDVQITADGVVVVFHDDTVDRTTNGVGRVSAWRWSDLQLLDAGFWHDEASGYPFRSAGTRISSLDEAFEQFPDVLFNIDLKAPSIEAAVFDVIARHNRQETVLVGSFHDRRIRTFRAVSNGSVATSAGPAEAIAMWASSRVRRAPDHAAVAYQLPFNARGFRIDQRLVDAIHSSGSHIHIWTVNEPADMEALLDLGVDGLVTDRPDLLNEVLKGRASPGPDAAPRDV